MTIPTIILQMLNDVTLSVVKLDVVVLSVVAPVNPRRQISDPWKKTLNFDRVYNFRSGCMNDINVRYFVAKQPSLKLKLRLICFRFSPVTCSTPCGLYYE